MLSDAQQFAARAPWAAVMPGVAIMLLTLAFNIVGDSLRDALDPEGEPADDELSSKVNDLSVTFRTEDGPLSAVDRVNLEVGESEVLAVVGESGCGKSVTAMSLAGLLPRTATVDGSVRLDGVELIGARQAHPALDPRPRDRLHLPGADDVAEPGLHRRPPDRRGPAHPCRSRPAGSPGPVDRAAQAGRHPVGRASRRRLPAPTVRRDAAAGDDRDGRCLRPQGPDRRRADHRARRHDPGRHPRRPAGAARTARHQHRPDHPRPRRRRRPGRPGGGHVRRTGRRDAPRSTTCSPTRNTRTPRVSWVPHPRPAGTPSHTGSTRSPASCRSCPNSRTPAPSPTAAQEQSTPVRRPSHS